MVKIRLSRVGKKDQIEYRIVVVNAREKRESKFIDKIGFYSPFTKEKRVDIEKAKYWLSKGAVPTDTVRSILVANKILNPKKKLPDKKRLKRKELKNKKEEQSQTSTVKKPEQNTVSATKN